MWYYNNEPVEEIDPKYLAFVYLITHIESNKKYIGLKTTKSKKTKQVKGKKKRFTVESDWRDYWSSSPIIKEMIEAEGTVVFVREVLVFAETKGQLNYLEEKFLYGVGAIESDKFFNSNIRSKMFKRNILNKFDVDVINKVLDSLKQEGAQ
jgi:hypothetical protein